VAVEGAGPSDVVSIQSERKTGTFEGIEFHYPANREELVRLLAYRFAEHNAAMAQTASALLKDEALVPLSSDEMRVHRKEYLQHVTSLLGMSRPTPLQEECYDEFLQLYQTRTGLLKLLRTEFLKFRIVHRVTVWDREELTTRLEQGEKLAGFSYDAEKKEGSAQFGFSSTSQDARFKELAERQKQLHRDYRLSIQNGKYQASVHPLGAAPQGTSPSTQSPMSLPVSESSDFLPVIIPPDLKSSPAPEQAEALWSRGESSLAKMLKWMAQLPQTIALVDPLRAALILHETTELGVVDIYMRGADRRWFCDGVANYVMWRVIRDMHGAEVARRAYDLPSQLGHYASLRGQADLRKWPALENESTDERASDLELARYAFATNALVLMNQQAGEDMLPKLFGKIGKTDAKQVTYQTVDAAWKELTGEPLARIVSAAVYGKDTPPALEETGPTPVASPVGTQNVPPGFGVNCKFDSETKGVTKAVVNAVEKGSPAERAGMMVGDHVISVSGQTLAGLTLAELRRVLHIEAVIGETIILQVRVQRGVFRKELTLNVKLQAPKAPGIEGVR